MIWEGKTTLESGKEVIAQVYKSPVARVEFVDGPNNPLQTLAKLVGGYSGRYDNEDRTTMEIDKAFKDNSSTALQTPMEAMQFTWLISGVTRAFTHQMVRTRIGASYVQESMRFLGSRGMYRFLASGEIINNDAALDIYGHTLLKSIDTYEELLEAGVESQDARGVLPTNILTSMYVTLTAKTFAHMFEQRFCCQAQGEWWMVVRDMKHTLKMEYGSMLASLFTSKFERGESCGYGASFDRPCTWRKNESNVH